MTTDLDGLADVVLPCLIEANAEDASTALEAIPAAAWPPSHSWAVQAIARALADGAPRDPLALVLIARDHQIEIPSGTRTPATWLWELLGNSPGPAHLHWYAQLMRSEYMRHIVAAAGRAITAGAFAGSLADVAALIKRQTDSLVQQLGEAS